jgi:hypothetical protein
MTIKLFVIAHISEGLEQPWFQHLRDFDMAHPGCHFEVCADAPDKPLSEIIEMMQINPGLDFAAVFERQREGNDDD